MLTSSLQELLYQHHDLAELDPASRRLAVRDLLLRGGHHHLIGDAPLVLDEIDDYGPLSALMRDPEVTDILINGPGEVWVERRGCLCSSSVTFSDRAHLTGWVERLVSRAGGRLDLTSPVADARLPDGSRFHAVIPPIAPNGPLVSIRRFPLSAFRVEDLIEAGSLSEDLASTLRDAVAEGRSLLIAGPTGAGKTTLMNALLHLVPPSERVVAIEELPELRMPPHCVSLVSRRPNPEGRGEVTLEDLVRASLRMRPDRIVIGEVRGPEALPALAAMATGHRGSMLTIHGETPRGSFDRLVGLALQADGAPSEPALMRDAKVAVDIVVQLVKRDGRRIVGELAEP